MAVAETQRRLESLMNLGLLGTDDGLFGIPGERLAGRLDALGRRTALRCCATRGLRSPWRPSLMAGSRTRRPSMCTWAWRGLQAMGRPMRSGWTTVRTAAGPGGGAGAHGDGDEANPSPWFALSLGMEIDGVRHNILPWLPNLIAAAASAAPDPGEPAGRCHRPAPVAVRMCICPRTMARVLCACPLTPCGRGWRRCLIWQA